jgi:HPt (histidine-containing phosphotransfer) domain-containing protein
MYRHIDKAKLDEISAGSQALIQDLVHMFTKQVDNFSLQLDVLLEKKDYEPLAKLAHKIKGSVSTLGMSNLAVKMKQLEEHAKTNDAEKNAKGLIETFNKVSKEALEELNDIITKT